MIKQAIYKNNDRMMMISKPYKDSLMITIDGKTITIAKSDLDKMVAVANEPCKLYKEIEEARESKGAKVNG